MASIFLPFCRSQAAPKRTSEAKRVGLPFADAGVQTPAHRIGKRGRRVYPSVCRYCSVQPEEAEKMLAAAKRERRTVSGYVAKCSNGSHHERGEIAPAGRGLISAGWVGNPNYTITPARSRLRCSQRVGYARVGGKELLAT